MKKSSANKKSTIWTRNFICVFVIFAMLQFSHTAINTLVSSYAVFLGAGPVLMGALTGMLFAVALVMRPFIGPITTNVNHRLLMILASAAGLVSYVGYAVFHDVTIFVIFRLVSGFQYAIIGALGMTMAADSVPDEKIASGISMYALGGAILAVFGPSLGIMVRDFGTNLRGENFGYTLVFLIGVFSMLISLIASFCIDGRQRNSDENEDVGPWYKNIIDVHALPIALLGALLLIGYSTYNAYMVPFTNERGLPGASTFFVVMGITMILTKPISGTCIEKFGMFKFMIPVVICDMISFLFVGGANTLSALLTGAVLGAIGHGCALPAIQTMAIQAVSPRKRAVASNTMYLGLDIGNFMGPMLGGVVYKYSNYGTVMHTAMIPIVIVLILFFIIWPSFSKRKAELASDQKK